MVGRIDSFSPATGSEFALIPVENATGNFTKITQRVPVRIVVAAPRAAPPCVPACRSRSRWT
jgi:membrane fusion protein (multidrug efflux system)